MPKHNESRPGANCKLWCNTHNRWAWRCDTEGGILLPCRVVDLKDILEIEDD